MKTINNQSSIGEKIRSIRLAKGIKLKDIATDTDLTPSFISQFERGLTKASLASMQKIVQVLGVPLASLFENGHTEENIENNVSIVRKENRRQLSFPKPLDTVDYLLTNLEGKLQVIFSTISPGGGSGEPYSHNSDEECVVVLAGTMEIQIQGQMYILKEGDTIKFTSRTLHSWKNVGEVPLETIWIITPPSF